MQNWNIAVTTFSKTPLLDTIRTPDDLRRLKVEQVQQVADELRHQYLIGFAPAALDGKLHKVEVRVTRPGMRVKARRNYLAAGS